MDFMELLLFCLCGYFTFKFLIKWYKLLAKTWPPRRALPVRLVFGALPAALFAIVLYTLRVLASFDVVGDMIYIILYIFIGYACVWLGLELMALFFDLSWIDDGISHKNPAALAAITGGVLGLTMIYAGTNIGDGPGWWCVFFAGALGLAAWFLLGFVFNKLTGIFERVTVTRDLSAGIRLGCYFLASGVILARACAGDWTSYSMTVMEFLDGWPVLVLTALAILAETYYARREKWLAERRERRNLVPESVLLGVVFLILAVAAVILIIPPLSENPVYYTAALWLS